MIPGQAKDQEAEPVIKQKQLDGFLTADEVATRLRVSRMTVYRLVHTDELAHVRVGRAVRISEEGLARYIAQGGSEIDRHALR